MLADGKPDRIVSNILSLQIEQPYDLIIRFRDFSDVKNMVKVLAVAREWVCLSQQTDSVYSKDLSSALKYERIKVKNLLREILLTLDRDEMKFVTSQIEETKKLLDQVET